MTIGAEQISIKLSTAGQKVTQVDILSQRTPMAARILEGKTPDEACALLPLLFSLCGNAQLQAGLIAFEEALGLVASPAHQGARDLLLCAEGVSEHTTRMLVDWPPLTLLDSDTATVRDLRAFLASFKHHIFQDGQNDRIGGASMALNIDLLTSHVHAVEQKLKDSVFHVDLSSFLDFTSQDQFLNWLESSPTRPAQCLKYWMNEGYLNDTWPKANQLPAFDKDFINDKLDDDNADPFINHPTYQGNTCETGPYERQHHHPLIVDMMQKGSSSALRRFCAKLLDLAQLGIDMQTALTNIVQDQELFHTKALHKGTGIVHAVRGQLCHRVWLDPKSQTIQRYRILAPTEWNFHPSGILKDILLDSDAQDIERLKHSARLAVMALDPCVGCDIVIEETD